MRTFRELPMGVSWTSDTVCPISVQIQRNRTLIQTYLLGINAMPAGYLSTSYLYSAMKHLLKASDLTLLIIRAITKYANFKTDIAFLNVFNSESSCVAFFRSITVLNWFTHTNYISIKFTCKFNLLVCDNSVYLHLDRLHDRLGMQCSIKTAFICTCA